MSAQTQQGTQERESQAAEARAEKARRVDFKMVTFALAGKDYGIDIMSVKEIAKANRFTYVPNAAAFVRGVYNLRGEIISVIDLRVMFHLPAERKEEDALENLLILKVQDHVFGVIVDAIDKVVGVATESIQPPHPIFGDINVKYIRGVVENLDRLYIILDIAKIFAPKEEREAERAVEARRAPEAAQAASGPRSVQSSSDTANLAMDFIKDTLKALKRFGASPINQAWLQERFGEWRGGRSLEQLQIREESEADAFLEGFFSPCTGSFWTEDYLQAVSSALPDIATRSITAWNPGCGRGYETYSLAVALRKRYPEARIKIWANDSDLLNISMAPNIVFEQSDLPPSYAEFAVKGRNGWTFSPAIKDLISFEYHDVLNANPVPDLDIVLCRDLLSFLDPSNQARLLADFAEKLKPGGVVIPGFHEDLSAAGGWERASKGGIAVFSKSN